MSVLDVLSRETWTQGTFARDAKGSCVLPWHPDASQFCLHGAILRVCQTSGEQMAKVRAFDLAVGHQMFLSQWNDAPERTWEEVEAVIRKAGI